MCLLNSKRIEKYESVYETIDDDELSYVKLINMQSKVICNRIYGNMAHLLVPFLMSIHVMYVRSSYLVTWRMCGSRDLSESAVDYRFCYVYVLNMQ